MSVVDERVPIWLQDDSDHREDEGQSVHIGGVPE